MEASWTDLAVAVESEPASGRARRVIAQIIDFAFAVLTRGSRGDIQGVARRSERLARTFGASVESEPQFLRYWYGGQMHMLASLCRVALADQLSTEVLRFVRSHMHVQRILAELRRHEIGVSTLASELGLDVSQLGKIIDKLEERELVETHKAGSTRWICLTSLGERVAAADSQPPEADLPEDATTDAISPQKIAALTSAIERVTEQMERIAATKDAIDRLNVPAARFNDVLQQLAFADGKPSRPDDTRRVVADRSPNVVAAVT